MPRTHHRVPGTASTAVPASICCFLPPGASTPGSHTRAAPESPRTSSRNSLTNTTDRSASTHASPAISPGFRYSRTAVPPSASAAAAPASACRIRNRLPLPAMSTRIASAAGRPSVPTGRVVIVISSASMK